jgi:hypothetical protein
MNEEGVKSLDLDRLVQTLIARGKQRARELRALRELRERAEHELARTACVEQKES